MRKYLYEIRTLYKGKTDWQVLIFELTAYDAIEMSNTYWRTDIAQQTVTWLGYAPRPDLTPARALHPERSSGRQQWRQRAPA